MGLKYDPDVIEIYRHIDVPNENAMIQTLYFGKLGTSKSMASFII